MSAKIFKKSTWTIQLLVGIAAFICSFYFEVVVISKFITSLIIATGLTLTLEIGKISAIIWHYQNTEEYENKNVSTFFRVSLLALSFLCTIMYLVSTLDKPNESKVIEQKLAALELSYSNEKELLESQRMQQKKEYNRRESEELFRIDNYYQNKIKNQEKNISMEMENTVNGSFKGPRYLEFKAILDSTKEEYSNKRKEISNNYLGLLQKYDNDLQKKIEDLSSRYNDQRNNFLDGKNLGEKVNDPYILAIITIFRDILGIEITPTQFTFSFSLFLSILIETCIVLSFSSITLPMNEENEIEIIEETPRGKEIVLEKNEEEKRIKKLKNIPSNIMHCNCHSDNSWLFTDQRKRLIDNGENHYRCSRCNEIIK